MVYKCSYDVHMFVWCVGAHMFVWCAHISMVCNVHMLVCTYFYGVHMFLWSAHVSMEYTGLYGLPMIPFYKHNFFDMHMIITIYHQRYVHYITLKLCLIWIIESWTMNMYCDDSMLDATKYLARMQSRTIVVFVGEMERRVTLSKELSPIRWKTQATVCHSKYFLVFPRNIIL